MGKILSLLFVFYLISTASLAQGKKDSHKSGADFLNIFIVVDCDSRLDPKAFKFVICNDIWYYSEEFSEGRNRFKSNVLHYIEKSKQDIGFDTTRIMLSNSQIETIYKLSKEVFTLRNNLEVSNSRIINFSPPYDGLKANILLDVNSGMAYNATIGDAEYNLPFKNLLEYLCGIVKKAK